MKVTKFIGKYWWAILAGGATLYIVHYHLLPGFTSGFQVGEPLIPSSAYYSGPLAGPDQFGHESMCPHDLDQTCGMSLTCLFQDHVHAGNMEMKNGSEWVLAIGVGIVAFG